MLALLLVILLSNSYLPNKSKRPPMKRGLNNLPLFPVVCNDVLFGAKYVRN